jgi:hypothetical protein
MCDPVTDVVRKACAEPFFGRTLITLISQKIRECLKVDPQPTTTFNLACGEAGWVKVRVEFFREDWEQLRAALGVADFGNWNEETLRYEEDLFEVTANAVDQELRVVFW